MESTQATYLVTLKQQLGCNLRILLSLCLALPNLVSAEVSIGVHLVPTPSSIIHKQGRSLTSTSNNLILISFFLGSLAIQRSAGVWLCYVQPEGMEG